MPQLDLFATVKNRAQLGTLPVGTRVLSPDGHEETIVDQKGTLTTLEYPNGARVILFGSRMVEVAG